MRKLGTMARLIKFAVKIVVTAVIAVLALPFLLQWWTPSTTSYMLREDELVDYQHVSIDHISRYLLASAIAQEDQQLGTREGAFDKDAFKKRVDAYLAGQPDPSGSTIPQQLVKNIYLYPDKTFVRKGLEAALAIQYNAVLSDKRMLALYVNYAQFGPHLYGVCAATWYYFNTPPSQVTEYQAAQLIGVLPLPDQVQRAPGGGILLDDPESIVTKQVSYAADVRTPNAIAALGGWEQVVATVGITDTASDHQAEESMNNCATMPDSVARRIDAGL